MNLPFTIIPNFLRNPNAFFENISRDEAVGAKTRALAISAIVFLAAYGFVTGLEHSISQALSSAAKMPVLFVATMFFCLPAFYFFSLVLGTQLSLTQVTIVVLAAVSVTAFLLLGLSPVTLFFALTSNNYPFFKLLLAFFVAVSGATGMIFLWRGMTYLDSRAGDANMTLRRPLLGLWFALYAFMGSQMAWRLSPFVGDAQQPFVLIQPSRDNFYVDVAEAIFELTQVRIANSFFVAAACLIPLTIILFAIGTSIDKRNRTTPQAKSAIKAETAPS